MAEDRISGDEVEIKLWLRPVADIVRAVMSKAMPLGRSKPMADGIGVDRRGINGIEPGQRGCDLRLKPRKIGRVLGRSGARRRRGASAAECLKAAETHLRGQRNMSARAARPPVAIADVRTPCERLVELGGQRAAVPVSRIVMS